MCLHKQLYCFGRCDFDDHRRPSNLHHFPLPIVLFPALFMQSQRMEQRNMPRTLSRGPHRCPSPLSACHSLMHRPRHKTTAPPRTLLVRLLCCYDSRVILFRTFEASHCLHVRVSTGQHCCRLLVALKTHPTHRRRVEEDNLLPHYRFRPSPLRPLRK